MSPLPLDYSFTIGGQEIGKAAAWVPVSIEVLNDYRRPYGPPAPPTYGPRLPGDEDRARWALATADLTDEQRRILTEVVDDWFTWRCDEW